MMQQPKVQFTLTIEDANKVIKALGRMPYEEVYLLIDQLQQQAKSQFEQPDQKEAPNSAQSKV